MSEVHAELRNGRVELTLPYRLKDLVKTVPGARWDADARTWHAPVTWALCKALRGTFGDLLRVGPDLAAWSQAEYAGRVAPSLALRTAVDVTGFHDDPRLYPFQRVGVAFLETAGSAVLADEMGTGKTIQLLRTVDRLQKKPILVVCPNSVKRNWRREAREWTGLNLLVVEGNVTKRRAVIAQVASGQADGAIINWEALRLHTRLAPYGSVALRRCRECGGPEREKPITVASCETHLKELNAVDWAVVIADEAHRGKDPKAKQTRAWWWVAARAVHSYAATGTPIADAPDDFWSILHGVAPDEHPQKTRYVDRYCLLSFNPFGGINVVGVRPETRNEFYEVVDPRFLRRPKAAVLPDLPPKIYATRYVELTPKQKKAYTQMADHMLAELDGDDRGVVASNPLVRMSRLSMFASAYAGLDDAGQVRLSEPSSKLDELDLVLEELGDQPAVVFAESRQLIELAATRLEKHGVVHGLITGKVSEAERQSNVDRFQAGELRLILATVGAGGEGITLTAAPTLIFLQRSWSMIKNNQATDRIHRIGQTAPHVTIIDLVAEGTVEEERLERLGDKEDRLQELARDEHTIRAMLGVRP